ncbi:MAG: NrfD/PsrC family molybdoenzyme membrane anchor subunit [Rhodoferax sp.]|uniref:NrfD/PsrC family molybdoenzyme membrane anchor subunit n=1 Tax=Rhodoferax sp. TaxID=50421 RepID=UPI00272023A0|nr:NrfD/PsrC family molybdoenzyme membrane anchor subunit [Rhodoferax sp.]MDO8447344.1 NrfD/PsrC family molybdoenzyme membrane anchor subunit [Rhodoferax sp.]
MKITLRELQGNSPGYYLLLGALGLVTLFGLGAVWIMEHQGHIVTGMNNQIVWGLPHVFAVFLVVAASGALNVASMASVFGKTEFKPLAPLSGLLAIALLLGGLTVLMLDLGRPDRLIIAMTHFNFKSIFALNIFLYSGFMGFVIAYLWTMMERRMNRYTPVAGLFAFVWRMALTTGTGSIFGFLVARQAYDSALLAPLFIALSLSYGLAVFVLVLMLACHGSGRPLGDALVARFARLQIIFIAAGLYFVLVYHLTNLYFTKHHDFERFLLLEGGLYTTLFWLGQVLLGSVLPLVMLLHPRIGQMRLRVAASTALVVGGGFAQMYVTIIGGQAFPLVLFPGRQVSSSFYDGVLNSYSPSLPEWLLGFAGVAIAGLIVMLALKFLGFLPERLDEAALQTSDATQAVASA